MEFKAQKPQKLIILGLLKFVKNSPIKPFKTCYYCPIIRRPPGPSGVRGISIYALWF